MLTEAEAIAKAKSNWWIGKTAKEIVDFQLYEERLCIPFPIFHKAVKEALGRPIWTHEFADIEGLRAEYEGRRPPEGPIESAERIFPGKGGFIVAVEQKQKEAKQK